MKIKKYKLIKQNSPEILSSYITKAIADGWQPFGSPFIRQGSTSIRDEYCQAIVSYNQKSEKEIL